MTKALIPYFKKKYDNMITQTCIDDVLKMRCFKESGFEQIPGFSEKIEGEDKEFSIPDIG